MSGPAPSAVALLQQKFGEGSRTQGGGGGVPSQVGQLDLAAVPGGEKGNWGQSGLVVLTARTIQSMYS